MKVFCLRLKHVGAAFALLATLLHGVSGVKCWDACETCVDGTANGCLLCDLSRTLVKPSNDAGHGRCEKCHPECATCDGVTRGDCLSCKSDAIDANFKPLKFLTSVPEGNFCYECRVVSGDEPETACGDCGTCKTDIMSEFSTTASGSCVAGATRCKTTKACGADRSCELVGAGPMNNPTILAVILIGIILMPIDLAVVIAARGECNCCKTAEGLGVGACGTGLFAAGHLAMIAVCAYNEQALGTVWILLLVPYHACVLFFQAIQFVRLSKWAYSFGCLEFLLHGKEKRDAELEQAKIRTARIIRNTQIRSTRPNDEAIKFMGPSSTTNIVMMKESAVVPFTAATPRGSPGLDEPSKLDYDRSSPILQNADGQTAELQELRETFRDNDLTNADTRAGARGVSAV